MSFVAKENGKKRMLYGVDEGQLLRVWTVIRCFAEMRRIEDPIIQSEILTHAQILLTAFVFDLEPLDGDQIPPRAGLDQIVMFDAK
jgi:hypothetical protein